MSDEQSRSGQGGAGQGGSNRRRRRRRGAGGQAGPQAQSTPPQPASQPTPQAALEGQKGGRGRGGRQNRPAAKRPPRKPPGEPRIGVGCIVLRGDEILMVREKGRWSLPKGGLDAGELVQQGAIRETFEETGLHVEVRELAFVVEFQAETWGHHLQFFYVGREVGGTLGPQDPDREVQEARFIPLKHLRDFLRFRPRLVALETWLRERRPRHFVFDLDSEPAMLRKRRRVDEPDSGTGAVGSAATGPSTGTGPGRRRVGPVSTD